MLVTKVKEKQVFKLNAQGKAEPVKVQCTHPDEEPCARCQNLASLESMSDEEYYVDGYLHDEMIDESEIDQSSISIKA